MNPFRAGCIFVTSHPFLEMSFGESDHQADDRPYLDIQRDTANSDPHPWYIEATDPQGEWAYGYYAVLSAELRRSNFRIRWGPQPQDAVQVNFKVDARTFAELVRVAQLMFRKP